MSRGGQSSTGTFHFLQAGNGQEPLQPSQSSIAPLNREGRGGKEGLSTLLATMSQVTHGISDHNGGCPAGPALLDGYQLVT